jgi:hypothetical protein
MLKSLSRTPSMGVSDSSPTSMSSDSLSGGALRDQPGVLTQMIIDSPAQNLALGPDIPLRDITLLTTRERSRVSVQGTNLIREDGSNLPIPAEDQELFESPALFLQETLNTLDSQISSSSDRRDFLINMSGFIDMGVRSARIINNLCESELGMSAQQMVMSPHVLENENTVKEVINFLIDEYPALMSYYLAERSLCSEASNVALHGAALSKAKEAVQDGLETLADIGFLGPEESSRALAHLRASRLSPFDFLLHGVCEDDRGSSGDYCPGSLQVEVKFRGSRANPERMSEELKVEILTHELFHSISAQNPGARRVGLFVAGTGTAINEGMTQYLTEIVLGKRGAHGTSSTGTYPKEVAAMALLHSSDPGAFRTLVNTYFGGIPNQNDLRGAIVAFDDLMRSESSTNNPIR